MGKKQSGRVKVRVVAEFDVAIDPDADSEVIMQSAVQVFMADPLRYAEFRPNVTSRRRAQEYDALRARGIGAPTQAQRALAPEEVTVVQVDDPGGFVEDAAPGDVPDGEKFTDIAVQGAPAQRHVCACAVSRDGGQPTASGSELTCDGPVPSCASHVEGVENAPPGGPDAGAVERTRLVLEERPWLPAGLQKSTVLKPPPR